MLSFAIERIFANQPVHENLEPDAGLPVDRFKYIDISKRLNTVFITIKQGVHVSRASVLACPRAVRVHVYTEYVYIYI